MAAELKPARIFYSYSHKDEILRQELESHLASLRRGGLIREWHDRKIGAGREWETEIDNHLEAADIILLLISADFVNSDYCYDRELHRALERHETGAARVIPIILRPVEGWEQSVFGKLQALPVDAKPIIQWPSRDEAWVNVARGIRQVVEGLEREKLLRRIELLTLETSPKANQQVAREIADDTDRATLAACVEVLAECWHRISADPNAQFWVATAIGEAGTQEAIHVLHELLTEEMHPYVEHGLREALYRAITLCSKR